MMCKTTILAATTAIAVAAGAAHAADQKTCEEVVNRATDVAAFILADHRDHVAMTGHMMIGDDFAKFKLDGDISHSEFDWTPCLGDQYWETRLELSKDELDTIAIANGNKPASRVNPRDMPTGMPTAHEIDLEKTPRYQPPGIICKTSDDAFLQAMGRTNETCRSFGGGWLVRLQMSNNVRTKLPYSVGAIWVRTESGEGGYIPPTTGSDTVGCDVILGGGSIFLAAADQLTPTASIMHASGTSPSQP